MTTATTTAAPTAAETPTARIRQLAAALRVEPDAEAKALIELAIARIEKIAEQQGETLPADYACHVG